MSKKQVLREQEVKMYRKALNLNNCLQELKQKIHQTLKKATKKLLVQIFHKNDLQELQHLVIRRTKTNQSNFLRQE
jgi:hypothetical protein